MNGVLIIDKPSGRTSHDVVRDVRKLLGAKKVGHAGTLDPLATGVLTVCINEATKLVQFFSNDDKEYRATMLLGVRTDTLDIEGEVLERCKPHLQTEELKDVVEGFTGRIEQRVPKYSAVKFRGKPLYKWTRQGVDIEPPLRKVDLYHINVEEVRIPYVTFTVSCSKGTYIRSLCADIGNRLGCGACLSGLRRTRSGCFDEKNAISLEGLADREKVEILKKNLLPIADTLPGLRKIVVDQDTADRIRKGYQPDCDVLNDKNTPLLEKGDLVKFVLQDGRIVAVAKALFSSEEIFLLSDKEQIVKILRVFN
ncbi:MAG: tRNA pseudouridine(55) synthase TruB [Deltaproteobacteria bacterium]|nr:tRNA pseudouridine(55) synthase TruB [Deltaproteobacteria bacterium]MBW2594425.1 tRNA pseudouridine(55) synthase TruB [Deltaproteobacteria bacterium]MBW2649729.1 tRNA pseudouridine(55) synthase TruB [Deltaproteobacteria bacterium]